MYFLFRFKLCLVLRKFEGKMQGKESRRKEEMKKNKKIDLKLINYFYMLFQNDFTYFNSLI